MSVLNIGTGQDLAGEDELDISLYPRRAEFGVVSDLAETAEERATALASLTFTATFATGPVPYVNVNFSTFLPPQLGREIVQILWEISRPKSPAAMAGSSFGGLYNSLRKFGCFLEQVNGDGNRQPVTSLKDIDSALIDMFEADMTAAGLIENTRYNTLLRVRTLLLIAKQGGLTSESLDARLAYVTKTGHPKSTPKDDYDDYVANQVRETARRVIDEAVQRITVTGSDLLREGQNPEVFGYQHPGNILFGVMNGTVLIVRPPLGTPLRTALQPPETAIGSHSARSLEAAQKFVDVLTLIFPSAEDIFAALAYLCLETGLPPTSIRFLKVDCLRNEKNGFADLMYVKARKGVITELKKRVSTKGKYSVGAVIKKFITIGQAARARAAESERDYLFVGCARGNNAVSMGCRHLTLVATGTEHSRRFVEKHGIVGSDGAPLKDLALDRLKKTYTTDRYRKVGGSVTDAVGMDKSPTTAALYYVNIPGTADLHEQVVANGLKSGLDAAMQPFILVAEDELRLRTEPYKLAADIGISGEQVDSIRNEEGDVWFASCLDFHASPYGSHGEECPSPIWGCLECFNAVIGSSKLPAILAFLNYVIGKRQEMSLTAWEARYGQAYARIVGQILPRFPTPEVADAKTIAQADADLLWLPAELVQG